MVSPIAGPHTGLLGLGNDGARQRRCFLRVGQLQAHATHRIAHAIQHLCVFQIDHGQAGIHFKHLGLHHAHHIELFQARGHTRRRHIAFRCDHGDFFTHLHPKQHRQIFAQNDVEFTLAQIGQFAVFYFVGVIHHLALLSRVDTAQLHAAHLARIGEQGLVGHIRRRSQNLFIACNDFLQILPRSHATFIDEADFHVRRHRQQLAAYLFLKPIHHRQHHNQRGHPQSNACNRHHRNKRHKAIALFRAQIAKSYPRFQLSH